MKIGYLSSNIEKYREVAAILNSKLPQAVIERIQPSQDIPETGHSFEENALLKLNWGLENKIPEKHQLDILIKRQRRARPLPRDLYQPMAYPQTSKNTFRGTGFPQPTGSA